MHAERLLQVIDASGGEPLDFGAIYKVGVVLGSSQTLSVTWLLACCPVVVMLVQAVLAVRVVGLILGWCCCLVNMPP